MWSGEKRIQTFLTDSYVLILVFGLFKVMGKARDKYRVNITDRRVANNKRAVLAHKCVVLANNCEGDVLTFSLMPAVFLIYSHYK